MYGPPLSIKQPPKRVFGCQSLPRSISREGEVVANVATAVAVAV